MHGVRTSPGVGHGGGGLCRGWEALAGYLGGLSCRQGRGVSHTPPERHHRWRIHVPHSTPSGPPKRAYAIRPYSRVPGQTSPASADAPEAEKETRAQRDARIRRLLANYPAFSRVLLSALHAPHRPRHGPRDRCRAQRTLPQCRLPWAAAAAGEVCLIPVRPVPGHTRCGAHPAIFIPINLMVRGGGEIHCGPGTPGSEPCRVPAIRTSPNFAAAAAAWPTYRPNWSITSDSLPTSARRRTWATGSRVSSLPPVVSSGSPSAGDSRPVDSRSRSNDRTTSSSTTSRGRRDEPQ